jgi:hypothetical protein
VTVIVTVFIEKLMRYKSAIERYSFTRLEGKFPVSDINYLLGPANLFRNVLHRQFQVVPLRATKF